MGAKNTQNVEDELVERVLRFRKPILWEGVEYKEVDLSGLENIKAEDMIDGSRFLIRIGEPTTTPEMSLAYACFIASRCTGIPIEFFNQLPAREAMRLKNRVSGFFYGMG